MGTQSANTVNDLVCEEYHSSELEVSDTSHPMHKVPNRSHGSPRGGQIKIISDSQVAWIFSPQTIVQVGEMFSLIEECIYNKGFEIIERTPHEGLAVKTSKKSV